MPFRLISNKMEGREKGRGEGEGNNAAGVTVSCDGIY